jgi:hypothetical protein
MTPIKTTPIKTVESLREELEAALLAGDVPTLATTADEMRAQLRLYRARDGDAQSAEAIDGFRRTLNEALAERLKVDVDAAERLEIRLPEDYPCFADELARDEERFAELSTRTAGFARRAEADEPPETGEEGD